jgi:hypothetical protein
MMAHDNKCIKASKTQDATVCVSHFQYGVRCKMKGYEQPASRSGLFTSGSDTAGGHMHLLCFSMPNHQVEGLNI